MLCSDLMVVIEFVCSANTVRDVPVFVQLAKCTLVGAITASAFIESGAGLMSGLY
jgi:hypothetical protein